MKEEDANQAALIKWASFNKNIGPYLFSIPNGGYRIKKEAAKLKLTGLMPGVSDLFLMIPNSFYSGLFIEMKGKGKKTSKKQKSFIERAKSKNYCTFVAYDWIQARDKILDYLKTNNEK